MQCATWGMEPIFCDDHKWKITYINTFYDEHKNLSYHFSLKKKKPKLSSFFLENIYIYFKVQHKTEDRKNPEKN